MNIAILRQIWVLIDKMQPTAVLSSDDSTLITNLVRQLQEKRSLNLQEKELVVEYLRTKLPLIRDLVDRSI
ncbi:MAG: hypothetical protein D6756_09705 [Cyanobacteria bacterium J083]|nr:MAG: hypothetical protein D6756_09705 [Cyanobacteria bacterium J083]